VVTFVLVVFVLSVIVTAGLAAYSLRTLLGGWSRQGHIDWKPVPRLPAITPSVRAVIKAAAVEAPPKPLVIERAPQRALEPVRYFPPPQPAQPAQPGTLASSSRTPPPVPPKRAPKGSVPPPIRYDASDQDFLQESSPVVIDREFLEEMSTQVDN
jgi:hypothetical protein